MSGAETGQAEHACGADGCDIDWLFEPNGMADPEWRQRIRTEAQITIYEFQRRQRAATDDEQRRAS